MKMARPTVTTGGAASAAVRPAQSASCFNDLSNANGEWGRHTPSRPRCRCCTRNRAQIHSSDYAADNSVLPPTGEVDPPQRFARRWRNWVGDWWSGRVLLKNRAACAEHVRPLPIGRQAALRHDLSRLPGIRYHHRARHRRRDAQNRHRRQDERRHPLIAPRLAQPDCADVPWPSGFVTAECSVPPTLCPQGSTHDTTATARETPPATRHSLWVEWRDVGESPAEHAADRAGERRETQQSLRGGERVIDGDLTAGSRTHEMEFSHPKIRPDCQTDANPHWLAPVGIGIAACRAAVGAVPGFTKTGCW